MELDTALDKSGLIPKNIMDDGTRSALSSWQDRECDDEWIDDIRHAFSTALENGKPEFAAALVFGAQMYVFDDEEESDLLYRQGVALTKMLEVGGAPELHDYRIRAFENALSALPQDGGWTHQEFLCRTQLADAWRDSGKAKGDVEMLAAACGEYEALIPALTEGRLGFVQHAKAAEVAALLAQGKESLALHGGSEVDPLYYWLGALKLALDPEKRAADTLGHWNAAMELIEPWIEKLPNHPDAKTSGAKVRDVLLALNLPQDNPDYGWVQYHIGTMAMAAGLQADALRMEAKTAEDQSNILIAITAFREALAKLEPHDKSGWILTRFNLGYALHSLAEAQRDPAGLGEAIMLFEEVVRLLSGQSDETAQEYLAQARLNLSEAMACKAEIEGDADLAHRALAIAGEAKMGFANLDHEEGCEVAIANNDRIIATIQAIEKR